MKILNAAGPLVAVAAITALVLANGQGDHTEQRPSAAWESDYCKSAPWMVACDTPEESAQRVQREAWLLQDHDAFHANAGLIPCDSTTDKYRCVFAR